MIERDASSLRFDDLGDVSPEQLVAHMNDPRVAVHLPLLTHRWDIEDALAFKAAKAQRWLEDGLGHWAIHDGDRYVGWGGFEKEGDVWDFGLVLTPDAFGLGRRVFLKALDFARSDERIERIDRSRCARVQATRVPAQGTRHSSRSTAWTGGLAPAIRSVIAP